MNVPLIDKNKEGKLFCIENKLLYCEYLLILSGVFVNKIKF